MYREKFKRLGVAMNHVEATLKSIGVASEPTTINLSSLTGEIVFVYKGHRWKLVLSEEDTEVKKLEFRN